MVIASLVSQLSERLIYDQLYQNAISDPELRRTREELANALSNAVEARKVIFSLFQDLDHFSLDEYKPFADISASINRLIRYLSVALGDKQQIVTPIKNDVFIIQNEPGEILLKFTTNRELARESNDLDLMGLDHPMMQAAIHFAIRL